MWRSRSAEIQKSIFIKTSTPDVPLGLEAYVWLHSCFFDLALRWGWDDGVSNGTFFKTIKNQLPLVFLLAWSCAFFGQSHELNLEPGSDSIRTLLETNLNRFLSQQASIEDLLGRLDKLILKLEQEETISTTILRRIEESLGSKTCESGVPKVPSENTTTPEMEPVLQVGKFGS